MQRALLIAAANLAVLLALLATTELFFRRWEHARLDRNAAVGLRKLAAKDRSELRVFAFGGSSVYGLPVPEIGFIAQMQYWLERLYPGRHIRIYNFALPGIDTEQVLRQLERGLEGQPDLVIVISGHNEFLGPAPSTWIDGVRDALSSHFATMRVLQERVARKRKSREDYVMPCQVQPWDRNSAPFNDRIERFERSVKLIVEGAHRNGVKLIVGTLPSNISDWPPVYKRLAGRDQHYEDTVATIQQLVRSRKYRDASDAVATGFGLYSEDATLYFLRGQIEAAAGSYAEARESFVKARDLDPVPWRTSSQLNDIIRKAALGVSGVYLADLERAYEEHAEHGLVGDDLIADNVHGTPLGESISAQTIIGKMVEIGFLPELPKFADCCPVGTFLTEVGYLEPKSALHLRALLDNATYSMKTPFLNYEASRMYLTQAMKLDEDSWEVWANLATLLYLTGDVSTGAKELQRATELHHGALDVNDRAATPYLKEALQYRTGCTG